MAPHAPWMVSASARVYGWLLWTYPPGFRRTYGQQMAQVFHTECRLTYRREGAAGVLRLWRLALADTARSVPAESLDSLTKKGRETVDWLLDAHHPARTQGLVFGLAFGAVHVAYALVNNLRNLDAAGNALLNNALMVALALSFGLAGWRGARVTGQVRTGVQASVLTWLISSVIGLAALWIVTFAFMETIRHNTFMLQDFARSGARDMDTFIVEDALGATVFGTAAVLAIGMGCGALGALLARGRGVRMARS